VAAAVLGVALGGAAPWSPGWRGDDREPPSSGVPTPVPGPDPSPSPDPGRDPGAGPFAPQWYEANTGVADASALRPGSTSSTHDGQVIENVDGGMAYITHSNVTLRNVRIRADGLYGVWVPHSHRDQVKNLRLENVDIIGVGGQRSAGVAPYGEWTLHRVRVRGFVDGVKIGSNQRIEDSWIQDAYYYPPGSHNDAIQSVGGSNVQVLRSRIEGPWRAQTSAFILAADVAPLRNHRIEGNLISGGNYSVYLGAKRDAAGNFLQPHPSDIVFRDNVFVRDSWQFGLRAFYGQPQLTWTNNTYQDGTPAR
jgi:hypothetical protein